MAQVMGASVTDLRHRGGSFVCTLPGAILGPRALLICAID
jgi:hypothetical protein